MKVCTGHLAAEELFTLHRPKVEGINAFRHRHFGEAVIACEELDLVARPSLHLMMTGGFDDHAVSV